MYKNDTQLLDVWSHAKFTMSELERNRWPLHCIHISTSAHFLSLTSKTCEG